MCAAQIRRRSVGQRLSSLTAVRAARILGISPRNLEGAIEYIQRTPAPSGPRPQPPCLPPRFDKLSTRDSLALSQSRSNNESESIRRTETGHDNLSMQNLMLEKNPGRLVLFERLTQSEFRRAQAARTHAKVTAARRAQLPRL